MLWLARTRSSQFIVAIPRILVSHGCDTLDISASLILITDTLCSDMFSCVL